MTRAAQEDSGHRGLSPPRPGGTDQASLPVLGTRARAPKQCGLSGSLHMCQCQPRPPSLKLGPRGKQEVLLSPRAIHVSSRDLSPSGGPVCTEHELEQRSQKAVCEDKHSPAQNSVSGPSAGRNGCGHTLSPSSGGSVEWGSHRAKQPSGSSVS